MALDLIMTSPSDSQVMSCHFLCDFEDYFNLLTPKRVLKTGLGGFLCSMGLHFCSDFGIILDLPISSLNIDI